MRDGIRIISARVHVFLSSGDMLYGRFHLLSGSVTACSCKK